MCQVDSLRTDDLSEILHLARADGLHSPAQLKLIRERCEAYANGRRADDYEVLVAREGGRPRGGLTFRKRSLTEAAYEIGDIVA